MTKFLEFARENPLETFKDGPKKKQTEKKGSAITIGYSSLNSVRSSQTARTKKRAPTVESLKTKSPEKVRTVLLSDWLCREQTKHQT